MLINYTPEKQLELFYSDRENVKFIKNVSEELFLLMVRCFSMADMFEDFANKYSLIDRLNSSNRVWIGAIKMDAHAIRYIKNKTPEMVMLALKLKGGTIKYIENPTEEMKLLACKTSNILEHISNPSEELIQMAFKYNPNIIFYMTNPSFDFQCRYILTGHGNYNKIKNLDVRLTGLIKSVNCHRYDPLYFDLYVKYIRDYPAMLKKMNGLPISILLLAQSDVDEYVYFMDFDIEFKYE